LATSFKVSRRMACRPMLSLVVLTFLLASFCSTITNRVASATAAPHDGRKLLVIMLDGFRWNYFDKFGANDLTGFNRLRSAGVSAGELIPVFPSQSCINYYSLMTGNLYL